ncbi:MAG: DUF91 domain-containing protein [Desulfobacterales bacterium]|nr:DUF91 domain-containing protein [Desulfobacterales bacterium]
MNEALMQEIIIKYPSEVLNEDDLTYVDREVTTGNRRLDIVLKDRMGRMILVEAQIGNLDTAHIDRHIDYVEGFLSKHPNVDVRVMYVANTIDPLRKKFLERRGYEHKEISEYKLKEIAEKYNLLQQKETPETDSFIADKTLATPVLSQNDVSKSTQKPSKIFQYPKSISKTWDLVALKKINKWLREYINKSPIGKIFEVKPTAIYSKKYIASITPERNNQGVRYLLWNLHLEGYINFPDNLHFVVVKRIE